MKQKVTFMIIILAGILIVSLNSVFTSDISSGTTENNNVLLESKAADLKVLWSYPAGGDRPDYGWDIAIDAAGYIYCVGGTNSSGAGGYDMALYKFDSNGTQIWNVTWGGSKDDFGYGIAIDSMGFIYCCGSTLSFAIEPGVYDVVLVKFDSYGDMIWYSTYHYAWAANAYSVAIDSNDSIYVTGAVFYDNKPFWMDWTALLIKFSPAGDLLWERTFSELVPFVYDFKWEQGYGVAIDSNDSVYVTGYAFNFGDVSLLLAKYDAAGNKIWNTTWNEFTLAQGVDVAIDSTGAIYCAGTVVKDGASYDFTLVKFDHDGNKVWARSWDGSPDDEGQGLTVGPYDLIYCTGGTQKAAHYDLMLLVYDSMGNILVNTTWGDAGEDVGRAVTYDSRGYLYCLGSTDGWGAGYEDFLLVKVEAHYTLSNPEILWDRIWGGKFNEYGEDVAIDPYGYIYCVGATSSYGAGGSDFLLIKFNANGKQIWNATWGGKNNDYANALTVDSDGYTYCVGYTESFGVGGRDVALVKFYPNGVKAWNITWGSSGQEEGRGVTIDSDGNIYVTGNNHLLKFSPNGTKIQDSFSGYLSYAYEVVIDSDANGYCAGEWYSSHAYATLIKFNSSGNGLWDRTLCEESSCWYDSKSFGIALDSKGFIYCAGYKHHYSEIFMHLCKYDADGNKVWSNNWRASSFDAYGYDLAIDSEGFIFCIGTGTFENSVDLAVVEFDSDGNKIWETSWGGLDEDQGKGLAIDSQGNLYCVGSTKSFCANSYNLILVKISPPQESEGNQIPGYELFLTFMTIFGVISIGYLKEVGFFLNSCLSSDVSRVSRWFKLRN